MPAFATLFGRGLLLAGCATQPAAPAPQAAPAAAPTNWQDLVGYAKGKGWMVPGWAWNGDGTGMNMVDPAWSSNGGATSFTLNAYFNQVYALL